MSTNIPKKSALIRYSNIIIVILATCTALFLAELGLRGAYLVKKLYSTIEVAQDNDKVSQEILATSDAYDEPGEYYKPYSMPADIEYNPYLGYLPKASLVRDGYKTNIYHFRYDDNFPIEKEKNEIRIFITGGSTAWGAGVKQEKLYSKILEDLFRRDYPNLKIRVISAGVGVYNSGQERILIENLILDLSPDYIVMLSGWNDTYFGYRGRNPLMEHTRDYFNLRKKSEGSNLDPPNQAKYLLKTHYVIDQAIYRYKYRDQALLETDVEENMLNPESIVQILFRNIHIVSDLSKRHNFKLMFYLQPSIYDTQKNLTDWEKSIVSKGEGGFIGFPEYNREVYSMYRVSLPIDAKQNNYNFVDGDDAIQNIEESLFVDHVHFGDRGNQVLANHMYIKIKKMIGLSSLESSQKSSN